MSIQRLVWSCLLWLLPAGVTAQTRQAYGSPVRWVVSPEAGGISPVFSLNAEYSALQNARSFVAIRGGIGSLFTGYSLFTLPHAITWNCLLNGRANDCLPDQPDRPLFAEIGIGGVYLVGATEEIHYRWSPMVGVRRYFAYNNRATGFWKAQLTPVVNGRLVPWGGIGIGLVID